MKNVNTTKMISVLIIGLFFGACLLPSITSHEEDFLLSQGGTFTHVSDTNQRETSSVASDTTTGQWNVARSLEQPKDDNQPVLVRTIGQTDEILLLQYLLPEPDFSDVTHQSINNKATQRITIGNTLLFSEPGKPEIPVIPAQIVIPSGHIVESINIIADDYVLLQDSYLLSYGEQPQPIRSDPQEVFVTNVDLSIYESDDPYPSTSYQFHGMQYGMGVAIAYIDIFPILYRPLSGSLEYYRHFTLQVVTAADERAATDIRVDLDRFVDRIGSSVENLEALDTYRDGEIQGSYQNVLDPRQSYSYVFVTSNAVANDDSVTPSVNDFIVYRQAGGVTSTVVTTEYIYDNYGGSTNSDKLRNFIKDAYNTWDTAFVTLGGDTNIIPLRTVWASYGGESDYIPTDLPYQCLDGDTWDNDFFAEVMIGRLSGQTATEISNQIHKIIEYETYTWQDYLQTGLSVGEKLDSTTYAKQAMLELETYFSDDWTWGGLFDYDGTWQKQAIINHINSNSFSVINHLGHSNYNYNMKMYNGDENSFTNTNYIFVKSQGCIPGAIDYDCITERFTTQLNVGGMFAAVMNSRYGWYMPGNPLGGPSHQLHRSFWYGAWDLDMDYFSEFNEYSHRMHYTQYRWDVLSSNYFGCAATPFRGKEIPGEPPTVTVTRPTGGEVFTCNTDEPITWSASAGDDPVDYIQLLYSTNSGSSWKLIETGLPNTGSYLWSVPNENSSECLVRVRAIDEMGRVGEGVSDAVFTILGVPPAPPMNLMVSYTSSPVLTIFDDFSDGTIEEWSVYSGTWDASNGYLEGYGSISAPADINGYTLGAYGRWEFDIQLNSASTSQYMRMHFIQIENPDTRYSSGYYVIVTGRTSLWVTTGQINLWRWDNGAAPSNTVISCSWTPNTNLHTLAIERDENGLFRIYLDNNFLGSGTDTTYSTSEYIGFRHTQSHKVHEIRVEIMGDDNNHNLVAWTASPDETIGEVDYYNVYRSDDQAGPWDENALIGSVSADGSSSYGYVDIGKGISDGIFWWYVVRAVGNNALEEMNTNAVQESYYQGMYTLTIDSTVGGEVTMPGEGIFSYAFGTVVNLVAEAAEGYQFFEWTGDTATIGDVGAEATTITILGNYSINAIFTVEEEPPNTSPVFGTPSPTNASTNQPLSLSWSIPINDPEGDLFSWVIQCSNGQTNSGTNDNNGTKTLSLTGLAYSTTYTVWVNATDPTGSGLYTRAWYTFTTKASLPPIFGAPSPANGSTNQPLSLTWNIPINDPEGDLFSWAIQCSNGQANSGTGAANGTKSFTLSGLMYSTTYTIWVNATDPDGSGDYTRAWYTFTTQEEQPNNPPNKPQRPSGETNGKINIKYTYTTSTTDPDGDQVYYLWDWGDGSTSSWLGPYDSGAEATAEHTWNTKGTYNIKVKAKDNYGTESDWSDPLPISMPYSSNHPILQFLYVLFERFPHAFPLLRHLLGV